MNEEERLAAIIAGTTEEAIASLDDELAEFRRLKREQETGITDSEWAAAAEEAKRQGLVTRWVSSTAFVFPSTAATFPVVFSSAGSREVFNTGAGRNGT